MTQSSCGDVLFYGYLPPPSIPIQDTVHTASQVESTGVHSVRPGSIVRVPDSTATVPPIAHTTVTSAPGNSAVKSISEAGDCSTYTTVASFLPTTQMVNIRPAGKIKSYCFQMNVYFKGVFRTGHSRNSSLELRVGLSGSCSRSSQDLRGLTSRVPAVSGHSRAASLDLRHARNSSADLNKLFRNDLGLVFGTHSKSRKYLIIVHVYS